jgi:hypothetical protein
MNMEKTRHRMTRAIWALYIAVALLSPLAHADVWTPTLNPQPMEDMVVKVGVWAVRIGATLIIAFAIVKIIQGRVEAGTGISGIASRGHSTVYEAFNAIFWFAVILVLLPFFLWIIAQAGLLPPYVADTMSKIYQNIWNGNI